MIRRRSFLKAAAATTALLSSPSILCAHAKEPATVYTGGPIFTMNKNNDIVEAIAIRGDTTCLPPPEKSRMWSISRARR